MRFLDSSTGGMCWGAPHLLAQRTADLVGHTARQGDGSYAAWLGDGNFAVLGETGFVQVLGNLCGACAVQVTLGTRQ